MAAGFIHARRRLLLPAAYKTGSGTSSRDCVIECSCKTSAVYSVVYIRWKVPALHLFRRLRSAVYTCVGGWRFWCQRWNTTSPISFKRWHFKRLHSAFIHPSFRLFSPPYRYTSSQLRTRRWLIQRISPEASIPKSIMHIGFPLFPQNYLIPPSISANFINAPFIYVQFTILD